jgi:hypothetical protein
MKPFVTAILVSLAAAASAAPSATPSATAGKGPRIAVEPASFDFGQALMNKTLTKDFILHNFGDEPLRIGDVTTSCGCTAALPSERVIPPGGHTRLSVSLQTRSSEGRLQKTVYVGSNDPAHATLEINLTVTVVRSGPAQ